MHPRIYTDFVIAIFEEHIVAALATILLHNIFTTLKVLFTTGPVLGLFWVCLEQSFAAAYSNTTVFYSIFKSVITLKPLTASGNHIIISLQWHLHWNSQFSKVDVLEAEENWSSIRN